MDSKDIILIRDFCLRYFKEMPTGLKIDNGHTLSEGDRLALSYYKAVVAVLVSKGLLKDDPVLEFKLVEPDSSPQEDDYL